MTTRKTSAVTAAVIAAKTASEAAKVATTAVTEASRVAITAREDAIKVTTELSYIKTDIGSLQRDMKLILENHLPHLKEDVSSLNTKITMFTLINIGGIILGIIAARMLK